MKRLESFEEKIKIEENNAEEILNKLSNQKNYKLVLQWLGEHLNRKDCKYLPKNDKL